MTKLATWKWIALASLLVVNAFLFYLIRAKTEDLDRGFEELLQTDVYFLLCQYSEIGMNDSRIGTFPHEASRALLVQIKKLRDNNFEDTTTSALAYFSPFYRRKLPAREALVASFNTYASVISTYFSTQIIPQSHRCDSLAILINQNLIRLQDRIEKLPDNSVLNEKLSTNVASHATPIDFIIRGKKEKGLMKWETGPYDLDYEDLVNLRNVYSNSSHSGKIRQAEIAIANFKSIFIADGRIRAFGSIYSLDEVTQAELDSICKFLLLNLWRTYEACSEAYMEVSDKHLID